MSSFRILKLVFCAIAFLCIYNNVRPADALSGTIDVNATVLAVQPVAPPTITSPADGQTVNVKNISVSGSCIAGLVVQVFIGNSLAGSTLCQTNNTYALNIDLNVGDNYLHARQYNSGGDFSANSDIVKVTYTVPVTPTPTPANPVAIQLGEGQRTADINIPYTLGFSFTGGTGPYAVSVNWGDGNTDLSMRDTVGSFTVTHTYSKAGVYLVVVKIVDSTGQTTQMQFIIFVKGAAVTGGGGGETNEPEEAGEGPAAFIGAVVEQIGKAAKAVLSSPATPVVYPFIQLGAALVIAGVFIQQMYAEIASARWLLFIIGRDKQIAYEKMSFLQLSAHFLRTPSAIISGVSDVIKYMPEITLELKSSLANLTSQIKQTVEDILRQVGMTIESEEPYEGKVIISKKKIFGSPAFWFPVIGSIVMTIVLNVLIATVGGQTLSAGVLSEQVLVLAAIIVILYAVIRQRRLRSLRRAALQDMLGRRKALDEAKNVFIRETHDKLIKNVLDLIKIHQALPAGVSISDNLRDGVSRLHQIVEKFAVLSKVESTQIKSEVASTNQLIDNAFVGATNKISKKQLNVKRSGQEINISQDQSLLTFVVASVLDNAAEYSPIGGEIEISNAIVGDQAVTTIVDHGPGFARDPEELFKLFTRGEDVEKKAHDIIDFSHGGMGLSLYLDKLIMQYMGGSIVAKNVLGGGANVTITVPLKAAAAAATK